MGSSYVRVIVFLTILAIHQMQCKEQKAHWI